MSTPVTLPELSNEEISRYRRHLILPEVGIDGQRKLKAARVLLVGTGGLGAPLGMYLAAAGVGTLGIVDFDAWRMRFRELKLRQDPRCPICGPQATIRELIDYEAFCGLNQAAPDPAAGLDEITAAELKRRLDLGHDVQLIDVREPHEYAIARLPHARLIPLAQVAGRAAEIDARRETVVFCKGGVRSAKAIAALKLAGFSGHLINLKGGILAWSKDVDPSVPRY